MIGVAPGATRPGHALRLTALARTLLLATVLLGYALTAQAETLFWFDDGLYPVDNAALASYRLRVADERDGIGWPAELRRIEDDALRMSGYVARPEPGDTDVTWIGGYQLYRMTGEHRLAEVGTTDAQARQQGLVTTFDEQGRLESETLYRDGKRHGEARRYHDGELSTLTHYTHGQRDGVHAEYVQGQLRRIEEYRDDVLDGLTEQYTIGMQPALSSRGHYRHGEPQGWFRQYEAGATISEIRYVDGKKDGPERYWHDQAAGQLREIAHYRNGKRVGEQIVNRYDVDSRVTVKTVFDSDNNLLARTEYDNGRPKIRVRHLRDADPPREVREYFDDHGYVYAYITGFPGQAREIEVRFDGEGKLVYRRELRNHHRVGRFYEADENHRTTTIQYDDQGRRHGGEYETLNGKPLRALTWVHGKRQGPFIEFAYNGQQSIGTYVDGRRDGVFRVIRDDQLIESTHYDHGTKDGEHILYADDGEVLDKGRYVDGAKQGAWVESTGYVKRWQGTYDNGERVGTWRAINKWGYPAEEGEYDHNGQRTGLWAVFEDNGKLSDCPFFHDGKRVEFDASDGDSSQTAVESCRHKLETEVD
ncbi:toxin-antitoxin system YwqK family antitoxin [Salinisphaera aquimarina]|uniref:Toxin-antitoxin system YwqK family antitoxin n=1 Tax=Salinisphaera aquimarina TaxID=2094031 RepID=A0ABV7EN35_9GAMM